MRSDVVEHASVAFVTPVVFRSSFKPIMNDVDCKFVQDTSVAEMQSKSRPSEELGHGEIPVRDEHEHAEQIAVAFHSEDCQSTSNPNRNCEVNCISPTLCCISAWNVFSGMFGGSRNAIFALAA